MTLLGRTSALRPVAAAARFHRKSPDTHPIGEVCAKRSGATISPTLALSHRLKHIFQPRRIAQRDHCAIAPSVQRVALPIGHHPTCAFDNGN